MVCLVLFEKPMAVLLMVMAMLVHGYSRPTVPEVFHFPVERCRFRFGLSLFLSVKSGA